MAINNYTLWCPHCEGPYERIGEDGICYACHNQTVLSRFHINIEVPVDGYTYEEAVNAVLKAVSLGVLPQGAEVRL